MALGQNFYKSCGKDGGIVGENPAALGAAVFSLSSKNLRGGVQTPPSRARVKTYRVFLPLVDAMRCVVFYLAGGHICAPPGCAKVAQTPGRARVKRSYGTKS